MLWWLAQNAVMAAILAGIVTLVCRAGRLRPAVRHALWLVVLLKLVTPPLLHLPCPSLSFAPLAARPEIAPVDASFVEMAPQTPPPAAGEEAWTVVTPDLAPTTDAAQGQKSPCHSLCGPGISARPPLTGRNARATSSAWPWPAVLVAIAVGIWLAGTAAVTALQLLRIVRFRLRVGRGRPAPRPLVEQMETLADLLGLTPPDLVVLPDLASPMVWGLGRAQLLWPARLLEGLPAVGQRAVLAHELAHLKRRDHWVGWLQLAAECLWWWYPLFWYVRGQLRREAELACDAWVVALLPEARRVYAEALLEVARVGSGVAVPVPALGVVGRRQDFARRLTMIMRECVPCRVSACGVLAVVVLALAALPTWSLGQPGPQPAAEPKQPAPAIQPAAVGPFPIALDFGFPVATQPPADPAESNKPNPQPKQATAQSSQPAAASAAQPAATPATSDRDRRLKELEDKLESLLKEIKDLRGGSSASAASSFQPSNSKPATSAAVSVNTPQNVRSWSTGTTINVADPTAPVTLSRASYKLPKEKAEALSAFLRENVKAQVLETKVEGENFIVTTTPAAQHVIGQFVALIEGKPLGSPHNVFFYEDTTAPKK
jgi:beta-lactamase regulating signal transducer with metallopeptidase domain